MNPYDINALGGFNPGQAIAGLGQQFRQNRMQDEAMAKQQQQEQQAKQQQEQTQKLYMTASKGDPEAIEQLYGMNPKMAQFFEQREQEKASKMGVAEAIKSKKAETDWGLRWRQSEGLEQKQALLQEALSNPLIDIDESDIGGDEMQNDLAVNNMLYNHLGKDQYKDIIAGNMPEQMTAYQAAMVQGNEANRDIRKQELEIKRLESQEKNLDRDIKRETNDLKKQELQAKLDENKVKKDRFKQEDRTRINNAILDAENKKSTITELINNDSYIDSLTGYAGRFPVNVTDEGVEAEKILDNIKNSMTIENLSVMSGPLTDKDIQVIASASSRLGTGMSEAALKKELARIDDAYDRVIRNYSKELSRKGYKEKPKQKKENNDIAEFSEEELQLINKYGG